MNAMGGIAKTQAPADFEAVYLRIGLEPCRAHYGVTRALVRSWLSQCGKQKLIERRTAIVWPRKHLPAIGERALGYKQPQVLAFIRMQLVATGSAPSYGEICDEFGIDRGNLSRMITALERRGLIARAGAGRVRRLKLL